MDYPEKRFRIVASLARKGAEIKDLRVGLGVSKAVLSLAMGGRTTHDQRIADWLNVPLTWLCHGGPAPWEPPQHVAESLPDGIALPLIGQVTAGDGWANPSQDPDDAAPIVIKSRWRAVRIEGRSAEPVVLPGQCVLVDDTLAPKHGRLVCVQTQDGRAYCKRFCDAGDGHVVLAGLNAGQDSIALHREDISRISVVVGTVYTDSVAR